MNFLVGLGLFVSGVSITLLALAAAMAWARAIDHEDTIATKEDLDVASLAVYGLGRRLNNWARDEG